jgi:hypothetical protein
MAKTPNKNREWSPAEVEAIVDDYFDMLAKEIRGEPYVKAEHRRSLRALFDRRTNGAIELKHCNISAVLSSIGHGYIDGYKPRKNLQELLRKAIESRLERERRLPR